MAQIAFQMIDNTVGMNLVSFELTENDMKRIYDAFKHQMRIPFDPETEDPTPIPTPKEILNNLSENLLAFILNNVHEIEMKQAISKLNIKQIQVKETEK